MPITNSSDHFSDNLWSNKSKYFYNSTPFHLTKNKKEKNLNKFLFSIDESPDFYDPYSDLNLFLSKKIKQELQQYGSSRKWSLKVQEELLEKITPEFQMRFPQYRLGITALKKTWEKVAYYSQQFEGKPDAITGEGKLNIHFLIRENLKGYTRIQQPSFLHPSHFSHQLAQKLSECIAVMDAEKIKLDTLTKLAWSAQRHLISHNELNAMNQKNSYDTYDRTDSLITKTIIEMLAEEEALPWKVLKAKVEQRLRSLPEWETIRASEEIAQKIERWTMQSDLVYKEIYLDREDPLFQRICSTYEHLKTRCSHQDFVDKVCKNYPTVNDALKRKIWIFYKYAWYTQFTSAKENSLDRFLKWHELCITSKQKDLSAEQTIAKLKETVENTLPLLPFATEIIHLTNPLSHQ